MSIDSSAVFFDRVRELGLEEHLARFEIAGWGTYADLAFATSFVPGQPEDERYRREIVERGLGDVDHVHRDRLRRLFFEAYTLAAADMKRMAVAQRRIAHNRSSCSSRRWRWVWDGISSISSHAAKVQLLLGLGSLAVLLPSTGIEEKIRSTTS